MPRLHRWLNLRLTLLHSRSDGDGLGSVLASRESEALCRGLLTYLKHGNSMTAIDRVPTAIATAPATDNPEVKSP
jgi:hypothetical protein